MPQRTPPRLQAEYVLNVLRHLVGSDRPFVVSASVLFLVLLGWATNSSWEMLNQLVTSSQPDFSWFIHCLGIGLFLLLLGVLIWWAGSASKSIRPMVLAEDNPQKVKALILFLSRRGKQDLDADLIRQIRTNEETGRVDDPEFRGRFRTSWRMPLEAIAWHLERVEQVVVIASADLTKANGEIEPGTYLLVEEFVDVVNRLLGREAAKRVQLKSLPALLTQAAPDLLPAFDMTQGISFEDADRLVEAVDLAYRLLHRLDIRDYDILVDITGGQKIPTISGAAVALAEGRRFQYVSTHDYHVRTYDVTYLS